MATTYSFSRIDTADNCLRNYYFTYILGKRGGENIYSYLGTATHDSAEKFDLGEITREKALQNFLDAVDEADMLGLEWMSENVRNNYIECVTHYFQHHQYVEIPNLHIEDYFGVKIEDVIIQGYIDKWYRIGNDVYIHDYKTSSMFKKNEIEHKTFQLLIYAIRLATYFPECKIHICFNMMKYAKQNGKFIERNKLVPGDFEDAIMDMPFTDESVDAAKWFVYSTVQKIELLDKDNMYKWPRGYDPMKDFFCRNLCGNRKLCLNS